jgi:hypothetical protein
MESNENGNEKRNPSCQNIKLKISILVLKFIQDQHFDVLLSLL